MLETLPEIRRGFTKVAEPLSKEQLSQMEKRRERVWAERTAGQRCRSTCEMLA